MPVRRGDEIVLLPVREIASLEADGELVHVTTVRGERHTISRPLKTLEARLEDAFLRLSRGVLVNVAAVVRLRVLPRGGLSAVLVNGAEHTVSRSQLPHVRRRLMDL
jgi:two-component system LytT family response regulator